MGKKIILGISISIILLGGIVLGSIALNNNLKSEIATTENTNKLNDESAEIKNKEEIVDIKSEVKSESKDNVHKEEDKNNINKETEDNNKLEQEEEKVKPEIKPETKPEEETKPEIKPETKPEEEAKPEIKPEIKPEEAKPEVKPQESFVSELNVAKKTNKIIAVVGTGGSSAKITFHEKDSNGLWKETINTAGRVGYNGISYNKSEGDGKTPAGVYSFGTGFGINNNPGSGIGYRKVTEKDYWVDDVNSTYYNKWVNIDEVEKDWNSAEHLYKYKEQYSYAAVINYNTYNIQPGKGSAIFLHANGNGATAGCVSVPKNVMVQMLNKLDSSSRIVIAPSMEGLKQY